MPAERWCRVTVHAHCGVVVRDVVLGGTGAPDIGTVDRVARLSLLGARIRGRTVLRDVAPALRELLALTGLSELARGAGGVEVEGEAEGREQALRVEEVEEEAHPGDLAR
jgi:hypothetical protein